MKGSAMVVVSVKKRSERQEKEKKNGNLAARTGTHERDRRVEYLPTYLFHHDVCTRGIGCSALRLPPNGSERVVQGAVKRGSAGSGHSSSPLCAPKLLKSSGTSGPHIGKEPVPDIIYQQ